MRGGHIYGNYCTSASATTYFLSNTAKNIHKWQLHYSTPIFLCDKQLKIKLGHIKFKYCNQFSNGTNLGERINERQEGDWPGASFTVKSTNCFWYEMIFIALSAMFYGSFSKINVYSVICPGMSGSRWYLGTQTTLPSSRWSKDQPPISSNTKQGQSTFECL